MHVSAADQGERGDDMHKTHDGGGESWTTRLPASVSGKEQEHRTARHTHTLVKDAYARLSMTFEHYLVRAILVTIS